MNAPAQRETSVDHDGLGAADAIAGFRVLVTGGTTGIGREIVIGLAARGARVVTFGRHGEPLREVSAQTQGLAGEVHGLTADVSQPADVDRVFAVCDEQLGGLDVLIACAALPAERLGEMDEAAWRYVIETNLMGAMACAQRAITRMRPSGGRIVLIGSVSADLRTEGESVYSATKAGVQAFAQALRREERDKGVRISVIEPGAVATDMQALEADQLASAVARFEMLQAADVARAVMFMLDQPPHCDVELLRLAPARQPL